MADKKTELMARFYEECQKKGYTNMHNDTQSLKAKVIATDLKLNYGNIAAFYEKAKKCYTQVQAEKAESQKQQKIQQQKEAEERARRAVNGKLLVTLSDRLCEGDDATSVRVYIRPDGSIYSTVNNGSKIEGAPTLSVKKGGALLLTYHPSQAVYTGATVGGVTTGGVHYTQSGYTTSKTHSGKGDIEISINRQTFTLRLASMSDYTCSLFQRDEAFRRWVTDKQIKCLVSSDKADFYYESIKSGRLDTQTMMNTLSMAAEEQRLSYSACEGITNLLGRIVHGQFPPTDDQVYDSAKALENATTSAELNRAIELFNSISDYKDAAKRAQAAKAKYDDVLQTEKEYAVLEKEARSRKNKKKTIIALVILIIASILAVPTVKFGSEFISKTKVEKKYNHAISLLDEGHYEEASELFASLGDYKDSIERIQYAEREHAYSEAVNLFDSGRFSEAITAFTSMDGYKESVQYLYESKYLWALHCLENNEDRTAYALLSELSDVDYKDSDTYLSDFMYLPSAISDNDGEKILCDYDTHGNIISGDIVKKPDYSIFTNNVHEQGLIFREYMYTYKEDGSYAREYCPITSSLNYRSIVSYNSRGQCVSDYSYSEYDGNSSSVEIIFEYYDNGRYSKMTYIDNNKISWVRQYAEDGTFIVTNYALGADASSKKIPTDEHNNIIVTGDNYRYSYDYDEKGNLLHIKAYQGNREKNHANFSYDEQGNLLKSEGITLSGRKYSAEFTYEYDYFYCPDAT